MKGLVCCVLLMLVCAFIQVQGNCEFEGESLSVGKHHRKCLTLTCNENGSVSALACPLMQCAEGQQIGYHELDISKPFPECCARPICKD
ncbi:uncharacterized protein [Linepithema humile]|uniref:uncharacterized protein n=1 Tax=Linepithema humile TaxID=83485 RepID=UPI00062393B0|nr:PREDICTED: uncharacterized protein LOC105668946 [Linepithema humile]